MSFLTVEDYNSIGVKPFIDYYTIDTALISDDDFADVKYDFAIVSRTTDGSNYLYDFNLSNISYWTGAYVVLDDDDYSVYHDSDFRGGVLTISCNKPAIKLMLLMISYADGTPSDAVPFNWMVLDDTIFPVSFTMIGETSPEIRTFNLLTHAESTTTFELDIGDIGIGDYPAYGVLKKIPVEYTLSSELVLGKTNRVYINLGNAFTSLNNLKWIVKYKDEELAVTYDNLNNRYFFDIDLSDKNDNNHVRIDIDCLEGEYTSETVNIHRLECSYPQATDYQSMRNLILAYTRNIELIEDIDMEYQLIINKDCYIFGDVNVNCFDTPILIKSGVTLKVEGITFNGNGYNLFVQEDGSRLIIDNCEFDNFAITDIYKGSVVNANNPNAYTEINGTAFENCPHTVYTGGELIVDNCEAVWKDTDNIDTDYAMFATVYDGEARITNSIMDIDITDNYYCTNELPIMFAQAMVSVGKEAMFNNVKGEHLTADNTLPFLDNVLGNYAHTYCKYYYPEIEECVITSPLTGYEDKNVCHAVIGEDYIYKNNTQITKASAGTENTTRIIEWEDD